MSSDIDDYRAKNKPTALSAILMMINKEGFAEIQKEVLAPFKDSKNLESKLYDIQGFFVEGGYTFSSTENITQAFIVEGGPNSKEQKFSTNYIIDGVKATIFFRIYTYGLSKDENSKVYNNLKQLKI